MSSSTRCRSPLIFKILVWIHVLWSLAMCQPLPEAPVAAPSQEFTLDSVRDVLTRIEDSIVFGMIERARFPINSPAYNPSYLGASVTLTVAEIYVRGNEALEAQIGRYQNPEEIPFFPRNLPQAIVPLYSYPSFLYANAASVNVSETLWNMYLDDLLPMFTAKGDDGNYAASVDSDLVLLQALSRRIHYGRFVAEVKFRDSPQDYVPAILTMNTTALMELVTATSVEEEVEERVEKKAEVFGQNVTVGNDGGATTYKVNPQVVRGLYTKWVIPLTKKIEVEYLLRRLQ